MKTVIATLLTVGVIGLGIGAYLFFGGYDVAATVPHWGVVAWVLDGTMDHSVEAHSEGLKAPDLKGQSMIREGAQEYHEMCETCHGGPGAEASPIGKGLYPHPPNLIESAREMSASEIFWVTKHGIKMTGMPSFGKTHADAELWKIVAFVADLPVLSTGDYRSMLQPAHESEPQQAPTSE